MIGKVKLRKEYKEQTGEDWKMLNPTAQPTIEYVKWLESRLIAIPDDVGQSEEFYCNERDEYGNTDCNQQCMMCVRDEQAK